MKVKFTTPLLEGLYNEDEKAIKKSKLSKQVITLYLKKINALEEACSLSDLWKCNGNNLEKIGDHRSIRLNDKRRVEIDFEDGYIKVVDILRISNHYGNKIR
ncbi:hypothetical protein IJM86_05080 [bacterium]|nr:hypothetical protein [bacterium]